MNDKVIELDLSTNRLGDCWMVLTALGSAAALRPEYSIRCLLPAALRRIAGETFASRIELADAVSARALRWTGLGLRDMLPGLIRGRRYVAPYPRIVAHVRKLRDPKTLLNLALLSGFDAAGLVLQPPASTLDRYIGFIQLACLPPWRDLSWEVFLRQAAADYPLFRKRLLAAAAGSPAASAGKISVFSSGVSQQSMPADWAKANLAGAVFCFHRENPQWNEYRGAGLETILFDTPEELIRLGLDARWAVVTDSFPSHLLQCASDRVTVCLTQEIGARVVSPCFAGKVVESCVPCSPCAGPNPSPLLCRRGFRFCLSWQEKQYRDAIIASIQ